MVDGVGGGIDYNMRREAARIWNFVRGLVHGKGTIVEAGRFGVHGSSRS